MVFIKRIKQKLVLLFKTSFSLFCFVVPINKKKICFCSFYGKGYSGDPKYICEHLTNSGYFLIWGVNKTNRNLEFPKEAKKVDTNSFRWIYHKMTSCIWVDNCRCDSFFKRKKTLYINTWHGSGAQKKCEKDAANLSSGYIKRAKRDSRMTSFMLSDCAFMTQLFKKSFWYNGPVLKTGCPRNEPLLTPSAFLNKRISIKNKLNIDNDSLVVCYCPTFRNDGDLSLYKLSFDKIKECLEHRFNKNVVILLRLHPNLQSTSELFKCDSTINVTNYDDSQEILLISDVVISDFSSIIYDFSLSLKLAVRYVPDAEKYGEERGLYFDINDYPWPIAYDEKQLLDILKNVDIEEYKKNNISFQKRIGDYNIQRPAFIASNIIKTYVNSKCDKNALNEAIKELLV